MLACFFARSERPAAPDPRLQVQDRDGVDRHLRRHPEDHRGRADPQLHLGGGQGLLLQDEGRLPQVRASQRQMCEVCGQERACLVCTRQPHGPHGGLHEYDFVQRFVMLCLLVGTWAVRLLRDLSRQRQSNGEPAFPLTYVHATASHGPILSERTIVFLNRVRIFGLVLVRFLLYLRT